MWRALPSVLDSAASDTTADSPGAGPSSPTASASSVCSVGVKLRLRKSALRAESETLAAGGVRVGAVVAHEVTPGVRDLHEDPGDELHRVDPLALGRFDVVVSHLGHRDDLMGAGGEVQPGEAHPGAHHVADEGLQLALIAGMHEDPVVNGEAASPPRIQQIDPLLAQEPPSAEESEHAWLGIRIAA
jgi:hypothetical protein